MKKNLTLCVMFVFAVAIGAASLNNVSAKTLATCASVDSTRALGPAGSASVVINEVYGGSETGGLYNADFIELYNPTDSPVNISDWSVQYYTAGQINGGAPTSTAHIPDATILQPFAFYVIRVSPDNRAGAPLPCENLNAAASFAETGIASEGGKLVLTSTGADLPDCTSTLNVVDRVGWGLLPVFVCNETTNAGAPSPSTSVQRRADSPDTDNNGADFTFTRAPTPCAQLVGPVAALVNVGGRVTKATGRGISRVLVRMTDGSGVVRTTYTSPFGYYNFAEVEVGQTLIVAVKAKHYNFIEPTLVVSLNAELTTVNFTSY